MLSSSSLFFFYTRDFATILEGKNFCTEKSLKALDKERKDSEKEKDYSR